MFVCIIDIEKNGKLKYGLITEKIIEKSLSLKIRRVRNF